MRHLILAHIISLVAAACALVLLVVFATMYGTSAHIVGFSIFGSSLLMFYIIRTIFTLTHHESSAKQKLHMIDHVMIFILTAATYTPVALLLPSRSWGWSIFGVVWGTVTIASILRITNVIDKRIVTIGLYGSLIVLDLIAFGALHELLSQNAVLWLMIGGLCYIAETILIVFRPNLSNIKIEINHELLAFPLAIMGSFAHFWAMFRYLI